MSIFELIADCWRVIRKRDSESAACAMIGLSSLLSDKDLQQMKDYCESLQSFRKQWTPEKAEEIKRRMRDEKSEPWHDQSS